MAEQAAPDLTLELEAEKRLLLKAEADIEAGWTRLHNQEDLLTSLRISGHETVQAERLVELLKRSLVEWERHRILIEQRVAYLTAKSAGRLQT
jgi:hypothetical protein